MVRYSDFSLHEKMTLKRDKTHPHGCYLIPPKKELSETFFQRIKTFNEFTKQYVLKKGKQFEETNLDSVWNSQISSKRIGAWTDIKFKNQNGENVTVHGVMVIPEMLNRYGYVSSYAYMINQVNEKFCISDEQLLELLYVALLQTSQIQFVFVMRRMLEKQTIPKEQNLFFLYQNLCSENNLILTGGPLSRYQPQSINPLDDKGVKNITTGLKKAIDDMDLGKFIDQKTRRVILGVHDNKKYNVLHVGPVGGLSFPALCVFTGICKSNNAIQTAKYARINLASNKGGSKNSYWDKMTKYLDYIHGPGKSDEMYYHRIMTSIASSLGKSQCSIENGCCAQFWFKHKWDSYFCGQDLYRVHPSANTVEVKYFGESDWSSLIK